MNKKIVAIAILALLMSFVEYARVMSPGAARAELHRVITNAKKNPPSQEKIKQLLNDISPLVRKNYEEMIDQIGLRSDSIDKKEEINNIDTGLFDLRSDSIDKKEEIKNIDTGLFMINYAIEMGRSKEQVYTLLESLLKDESFNFDDNIRAAFKELAIKVINKKFSNIEMKQKGDSEPQELDITTLSPDQEPNAREQEEFNEEQVKKTKEKQDTEFKQNIDAINFYLEELIEFFKTHFTPTKENKIVDNKFKKGLSFTSALRAARHEDITKGFNEFFKAWHSFSNQRTNNITVLQKATPALLDSINTLYGIIYKLDCKVEKNEKAVQKLYTLMGYINMVFNSKIDKDTLLEKKEKNNGSTVINNTDEYHKYLLQYELIENNATKKCK